MLLGMLDATRTLARDSDLAQPPHPLTVASVLVLALAVIAPGATFRPQLFTMTFLAVEPRWAELTGNPRFTALLATLGLRR